MSQAQCSDLGSISLNPLNSPSRQAYYYHLTVEKNNAERYSGLSKVTQGARR